LKKNNVLPQRSCLKTNALVQKLWNYCNILRDDGLSYGDHIDQLTFLLFLKMADEQSKPPFQKLSLIAEGLQAGANGIERLLCIVLYGEVV